MKIYVITVSTDIERKSHIQKQLNLQQLETTFINEGDIKDLSDDVLNTYFEGMMKDKTPRASCAYKHLLAYMNILKNKDKLALILEDDIIFYKNFHLLYKIIDEIKERGLKNFIISLEDSTLEYVKGSKRIKNQLLYQSDTGRTTGGYLIDNQGAEKILTYSQEKKIDLPIDHFHNLCKQKNIIQIYWSHPAIMIQKTLYGKMKSLITPKEKALIKSLSFRAEKVYKKILFYFR